MDASRDGGLYAGPTPGIVLPTTVFRYKQRHSLNAIFEPKSIAVVEATEKAGSVGRTLLWNLISNPFGGTVFPINARRASVLGIQAFPDLASLPEQVDLAVIVTPAPTVSGIIAECVEAGVKGANIISAGFKENGAAGAGMEQACRGKLRIIGPNCLGVMSPLTGLNATFASAMARPGNVGFISHSGALCTAVLDWSLGENVGLSAFISISSMVGVGRLIKDHGENEAEFAILVTDQFQRKGLGAESLRWLIKFGQDEKLQRLTGDIDLENHGMQEVCKKLGFRLQYSPEEHLMSAELEL